MSRADVQRLAQDLDASPELARRFESLADDASAWQRLASEEGYDLTLEEVQGLRSSVRELSDEELEDVAGGWDGGTSSTGSGTGGG